MGFFKRGRDDAAIAVARRRPDLSDGYPGSTDELFAEIAELTRANRARRDIERERRLLWLRHYAGIRNHGGAGRRRRLRGS